jgi:hypothetical protein
MPENLLSELDVALNEAEWHNARVRPEIAEAMLDFRVWALPEVGPEPNEQDRVLRLRLTDIGRVAASLRAGRWDDEAAQVEDFQIEDLNEVVHSFGVQPIYGWSFFDPPEQDWAHWKDRLSLDLVISDAWSRQHVLDLFQESGAGPARHLDLRIWFNGLAGYDFDSQPVPLVEAAAAGRRWWDALFARDPRVAGHGIVPAGPPPK